MEAKKMPGIHIIITQQLDILLAEELSQFERVVFIDASIDEPACSLQPLRLESHQPQSFSHHINAAMLVRISQQLYAANTAFYICAIGTGNFDMGHQLSETARRNAALAVSMIIKWLQGDV
jgi:Ni,Fe-hydrogenase maturation factor